MLDIFVLCRLYRESISHFLLRRLISTKKYSLSPELNFECFLAMFVCSVWLCTFLTAANYFRRLYTTFGSYILLLMAIYYFCRLYTNFGGYIVLSVAIYYFQSYMLLSTLYTYFSFIWLCFIRIQDLPAITRICGLKTRFKFNISLLVLIQFCFFCSAIAFSINFNSPFWKCRNTQMLKVRNFVHLALQMVCKGNM